MIRLELVDLDQEEVQVDKFNVKYIILEQSLVVVEQYRGAVADLIATTVSKWDPLVTSRRIELAIGKDLQFIRINGTLVGGLLGLAIYTVTKLMD